MTTTTAQRQPSIARRPVPSLDLDSALPRQNGLRSAKSIGKGGKGSGGGYGGNRDISVNRMKPRDVQDSDEEDLDSEDEAMLGRKRAPKKESLAELVSVIGASLVWLQLGPLRQANVGLPSFS
jgi:hypothetical protein